MLHDAVAGTVRCDEAVNKLPEDFDIVVNIQGDEPLIEPSVIDGVVEALQDSPDARMRCAPLVFALCRLASMVNAADE